MPESPLDWESIRDRLHQAEASGGVSTEVSGRQVLIDRAARLRAVERTEVAGGREMIFFERGQTSYALPIEALAEVRLVQAVTSLPGISPVLKGLTNIRGRLVAVHDLGAWTHGSAMSFGDEIWLLIGYGHADRVALLADAVTGIRAVLPAEIRPTPASLGERRTCFLGASSQGVLLLDLEGLLQNRGFFYA